MQTSRALLAIMALTGPLAAMTIHCASTECDQYSDCDQGYTCTAGRCVLPPADASVDAPPDRVTDASSEDSSHGDTNSVQDGSHDSADSTSDAHDGTTDSLDRDSLDGMVSDAGTSDANHDG
jgi:hypothetical protein